MFLFSRRILTGAVLLAGMAAMLGCGGSGRFAGPVTGPVTVSVALVIEAPITGYEDFTGRTHAVNSVTLKARATGYLDEVLFKDGEFVKKGQLLYQIDERTYAAQVKNARAAIKRTEATLENANAELARARQMRLGDAISRQEYDKITAQKRQAEATLVDNKATLETAELNLGFCKVKAPIDGIISRTQITEGNLVTQDQTTLTTIVSIDPIYAYFDVDERTVLRIQQMIREEVSSKGIEAADKYLQRHKVDEATRKKVVDLLRGRVTDQVKAQIEQLLQGSDLEADWLDKRVLYPYPKFRSYRDTKVPVLLATQIEQGYPHEGFIDFVDNQLNASTGTLRVRGNFPNPDRVLTPNLFVRIRLPLGEPQKAVLVSDGAVVTQQDRKFLFVVNDNDVVEMRPVKLGPLREGLRVVESGVKAGERVVVSGLQRVGPDSKVQPKLVPMPGADERGPAPPPVVKEKKN